MTDSASETTQPIAFAAGEGEAFWFFGGLVTLKATGATTGGAVAVTEQLAPRGAGSPLHVHTREDEWFFVLEGELTFWVDGKTIVAGPGGFVYGPKNIPHTFDVTSDQARFLLVAEPAGFEDFVRAVGQPAERLEIPPPATEPPDMEALMKITESFGITILGPPGIPE